MRPLGLLPAVLLASSLAAASCSWNPFASDDCEHGDFCDVRVEVSVSPREFVPGDTVHITITASNPTDRVLNVSGSGCAQSFSVEAAGGEPVGPRFVCALEFVERSLQPGEVLQDTFEWTGERYDSSRRVYDPLPAGTYRVRGYFETARSGAAELTLLPAAERA